MFQCAMLFFLISSLCGSLAGSWSVHAMVRTMHFLLQLCTSTNYANGKIKSFVVCDLHAGTFHSFASDAMTHSNAITPKETTSMAALDTLIRKRQPFPTMGSFVFLCVPLCAVSCARIEFVYDCCCRRGRLDPVRNNTIEFILRWTCSGFLVVIVVG